jgi:hypothetical protein
VINFGDSIQRILRQARTWPTQAPEGNQHVYDHSRNDEATHDLNGRSNRDHADWDYFPNQGDWHRGDPRDL